MTTGLTAWSTHHSCEYSYTFLLERKLAFLKRELGGAGTPFLPVPPPKGGLESSSVLEGEGDEGRRDEDSVLLTLFYPPLHLPEYPLV
jgi:hypothetical protein